MIPKIHKKRQFDGGIQNLYKNVGSFSLTTWLNKRVPTFKPNTFQFFFLLLVNFSFDIKQIQYRLLSYKTRILCLSFIFMFEKNLNTLLHMQQCSRSRKWHNKVKVFLKSHSKNVYAYSIRKKIEYELIKALPLYCRALSCCGGARGAMTAK